MKTILSIITVVAVFSGCATTKEWSPTAGSRADGTMILSYQYNNFEQPTVDDNQGLQLATARCQQWGYTGAEAFGGVIRKCAEPVYGLYGGCNMWQVDKQYQCIGKP